MPPEEKSQSRKEKRGGGAPQCSHHCSGISPLHCDGQALPQVGEGLGFPGGLFETATQFSQERESLWSKRACRLDGHRCEDVVLVEGCVLFLLVPLSQGCHCACLSGGTWLVGGANVSGHVASHTRSLPLLQGTRVTPSGRLPSERERPVGSSLEGSWAADNARWMMSLTPAWRW